jgi:hypothetical protein
VTAVDAPVGEDSEKRDRDGARPSRRFATWSVQFFGISVVAALTPVVVATARALHRGWLPLGDDADVQIRSFDVFTHNIPLVGGSTSAAGFYGTNINHPGPLLFDLLAVPTHLGGSSGLAIGVALLNCAALLGVAVFAYRRGGPLVGATVMAVAAALVWAYGSETLFAPWQGFSVLFPFLLLLVLAWSTACGDLVALPIIAFVGSLVLQTHLTYSVLAPALLAWALVGLFITLRGWRRDQPERWPVRRRRAVQAGGLAAAVLLLAWSQPLIQEFTSSGSGNLTLLIRSALHPQAPYVGYGTGAKLLGSVLSIPPWWLRPSFVHTFQTLNGWTFPSAGVTVASLLVVGVALSACAWEARRTHNGLLGRAIATAGVAIVAAWATTSHVNQHSLPVQFAIYVPHTLRFLWPVAAFAFLVILLTVVDRLRGWRVPTPGLVATLATTAVAFSALAIPTAQATGPNSLEWAIPTLRTLDHQLGGLDPRHTLLIDEPFQHFGTPYAAGLMTELQRRGVPFVGKDPTLITRYGPGRRFDGHNASTALVMRTGNGALTTPPGTSRVALALGLGRRDREELVKLRSWVQTYVRRNGIRLSARGAQAVRVGELTMLVPKEGVQYPDVDTLLESGQLVSMVQAGDLVLPRSGRPRFDRYATLEQTWDRATVALFVGRLGPGGKIPGTS